IRKLPTHLIEAFKATLEESAEADILLHVVDLSSDQMEPQMEVVENLMKEFGWDKKPVIYVFNKVDKAGIDRQMKVKVHPRVFVSAVSGQNIDRLKEQMVDSVRQLLQKVQLYFPKQDEQKIYDLGRDAQIIRTEPSSS